MNILLLGSGGREHAFARSLSMSPRCTKLFIAPGNAGTSRHGTNVNLSPNDFPGLKSFVLEQSIGLVVVGPEDPLVNGVTDFFSEDPQLRHIPVIGPSRAGAQLEGSKDFSKAFMKRNGIPTAAYATFTYSKLEEGYRFLETLKPPYVLKADGLAAGKGVLILEELEEAKQELKAMLGDGKFGKAGEKVVIEEFLKGIEVSFFVLTDGVHYKILPEAKDYKRIGEGDKGLNTGGMGAVSPVPFVDAAFVQKLEERIVKPTVQGLRNAQIPYCGFIFIGLMNVAGEPYVIEYNCRMGDPETEAVLPRIKTDFVELMQAVAEQKLDQIRLETDPRIAATVVMVSGGYPGNYEKGYEVTHLDRAGDTLVFHAGTTLSEGKTVTSGGRVLALTSLADTLEEALAASYAAAKAIQYDYAYYRKDIGRDLMLMDK
ncbi:MAG: phosphoribosylamine--glycine ligase [Bacteroidia bacterium]|nr:phosphoribosylamine--glycine ligase [Bacteroidia bacterium]